MALKQRKLTHDDFLDRLDRMGAGPGTMRAPHGRKARRKVRAQAEAANQRPARAAFGGFFFALAAIVLTRQSTDIPTVLANSAIPRELHFTMQAALVVFLSIGLVLAAKHVLTWINPRALKRRTSGGVVAGLLFGLIAAQIPDPMWQNGYAYLDQKGRAAYNFARVGEISLEPFAFDSAAFVSSIPK